MADSASLIGQKLGQYHIVRHIGRGGMADVYLAHDETLRRDVVIKTMLPAITQSEELLARFQREAQTTARLFHPNLVQVFSAGVTPAEQPYLVMQYIEGGTLSDYLRRLANQEQWVTAVYALSIIRQVADALGVAHQAGVIHRDIKPSNILLRGDGTPVLTDLGIAAVQMETTKLTQTGGIIGTPHYMAPEQGSGKGVDARSDIYSLGIILYELLSGKLPFEADSPWGVIHQHIYEQPPALPQLRPGLAVQTYQVVETCLQKDPARRYQTTQELVAALDQALAAEGAETDKVPGTWRPPAVQEVESFLHTTRATEVKSTKRALQTRSFDWRYVIGGILFVGLLSALVILLLPGTEAGKETAENLTLPAPTATPFPTITPLPTSTVELVQTGGEGIVDAITAVPTVQVSPAPPATSTPPSATAVPATREFRYPDGLIAFSCSGTLLLYDPVAGARYVLPGQPATSIVPAFAHDGTEISFRSNASGTWQVYTAQIDGSQMQQITSGSIPHYEAVWSPDGREFAFVSDQTGSKQIYVMNRDGSNERALMANSSINDDPSWSVNGRIAFESNRDGRFSIYQISPQGGAMELLVGLGESSSTPAWSPDGKSIAFEVRIGDERHIWVADENGRNPVQVTMLGLNNERPAWSHDGSRLAFHSNYEQQSNSDYDIWIIDLQSKQQQRITFDGNCYDPAWSAPTGR